METNKTTKNSGKIKEDKRIRRTKKLLKTALTELIREKGFENISVQDLIDRADVGRTSFYTHFKSKEDLLLQNLDDLEHLFKPSKEDDLESELRNFSLNMLIHLKENWRLAKALIGNKKIPIVRNYVQGIILKYYKNQFRKKWGKKRTPFEIEAMAVSVSGALVSLTLWWLSMDKPVAPEKIQEVFINFINI